MTRDHAAAAGVAGALVFCTSYAVQRLGGYLVGDPVGAMRTAHVPLTWRLAIAVLHAGIAALMILVATDAVRARLLGARWLVWAIIAGAAGIALWTR